MSTIDRYFSTISANGWIVQAPKPGSDEVLSVEDSLQDDTEIVIVYWPQYLEWVGLALLPVVLGGLALWSWRGRKKRWS